MKDCMNIAIVGGPSSRRATDTIVNAIHDMNIMKYIRTDKDDDGKDIFFVKGFTHIYIYIIRKTKLTETLRFGTT